MPPLPSSLLPDTHFLLRTWLLQRGSEGYNPKDNDKYLQECYEDPRFIRRCMPCAYSMCPECYAHQ